MVVLGIERAAKVSHSGYFLGKFDILLMHILLLVTGVKNSGMFSAAKKSMFCLF